jgi:hypothetical protein
MADDGVLDQLVEELGTALQPLVGILSSPAELARFLEQRGIALSPASMGGVVGDLDGLRTALEALGGDGGAAIDDVLAAIENVRTLPDAIAALGKVLPPTLPAELFDYLLIAYLMLHREPVYRVLVLLGLIEQRMIRAGSGDADARDVDYVRLAMRWDRLGTLFTDPGELAARVYGWGTPELNSDDLLVRLKRLADSLQVPAQLLWMDDRAVTKLMPSAQADPVPPVELRVPIVAIEDPIGLAEAGVVVAPVEGTAATDTGIGLMPYARGALTATIPLTDVIDIRLSGQANFEGGFMLAARPSGFELIPNLFDAALSVPDIKVELVRKPAPGAAAIRLLGEAEGTRIECAGMLVALGGGDAGMYVAGGILGLRVVVVGGSDGLLSMVLPEGMTIDAGDVLLGWRPGRGITFEGGAGIRVRIPVDLELGPLKVSEIEALLGFAPNPRLAVAVDASLSLGPLFMAADGLGVGLDLIPAPRGKLGGFDLGVGLIPPTGYAASVAGGPIKGGGAIFVGDDTYSGALSLRFTSFGISAFAILTTRMPSGAEGFSFLATLFVEFEIQLSMGFKLTGLGGLIGINRTTNVEALRETLRAGNLDGLLFPENPIEDAQRILRDMATDFPTREGQHVFGPMARLAWGTPSLIEATIGVILEVGPAVRILILGKLRAALPTPDEAVVVLSIQFLGVIDFEAKTLGLDATLANSRILEWPISGDMALRTGWGEGADFVLSVGGFHPQFPTPAGFPALRRLTVNFGTDNPRVTFTAYMALTSNTAQVGARLELLLDGPDIPLVGKFKVEGQAWFDALFQFNPFFFDLSLGLALALLRNEAVICAIGGDLRLTGPNPFHITGKAYAEVLGCRIEAPVDETFGEPRTELAAIVDALAVLLEAIAKPDLWEPVTPASLVSGVNFGKPEPGAPERLLVHPMGGLRFVQRALPLEVALEKLGTSRLSGTQRTFALAAVDAAGAALPAGKVRGQFAPGQFFDLDDDDRLAAPATEHYVSGLDVAPADQLVAPVASAVPLRYDYETVLMLGDDEPAPLATLFELPGEAVVWFRDGLRGIGTPLNLAFGTDAKSAPLLVHPETFVAASGKVSRQGVVAGPVAGAALAATYGELRATAPGAVLVGAHLADPSTFEAVAG